MLMQGLLTLNVGLATLEAYKSPRSPSNVFAVGYQAKKFGCCQFVIPIVMRR